LKQRHKAPLLSTIHATERGRGRGSLASEQAKAINHVEWWLAFESWRVIACSQYMAEEIGDYFECPADKIDVVPNGVDTGRFDVLQGQDLSRFRSKFALSMEPIVFSVGRIVYEKGMQVLVRAMPAILEEMPAAKAVIAGKGPELESVRDLAESLGLDDRVQLAGFVTDEDRDRLFATANCAVFPSLYEPFGIVALEAMAAKCPVVATTAGGLRDVVEHGVTGISTAPDDPDALARGILDCLQRPAAASERVKKAYRVVREEYNWGRIAEMTERVYRQVIAERAITDW
jgi:glycosyltransferase involved in cell wall biosynthesis